MFSRGLVGVALLALLILLIDEAPKARGFFKRRKLRRNERAVSATAFEELKGFIHRFEDFVNVNHGETLQRIVFGKLCESFPARYFSLNIAPAQIFGEFWEQLRNRTDRQEPSSEALRQAVLEFNSLIRNFGSFLVCPLYQQIPMKLSPEMLKVYNTQGVDDDLIQFRERYVKFIGDYQDFLKGLDRKLQQGLNLGYYFECPKPVMAGARQPSLSV
jgi:hypothetical protein